MRRAALRPFLPSRSAPHRTALLRSLRVPTTCNHFDSTSRFHVLPSTDAATSRCPLCSFLLPPVLRGSWFLFPLQEEPLAIPPGAAQQGEGTRSQEGAQARGTKGVGRRVNLQLGPRTHWLAACLSASWAHPRGTGRDLQQLAAQAVALRDAASSADESERRRDHQPLADDKTGIRRPAAVAKTAAATTDRNRGGNSSGSELHPALEAAAAEWRRSGGRRRTERSRPVVLTLFGQGGRRHAPWSGSVFSVNYSISIFFCDCGSGFVGALPSGRKRAGKENGPALGE